MIRGVALACTAGLAACGDAARPQAMVRDSAGVRIFENHRPALDEAASWRVDEAPLLRIGVAEGAPEYQLSNVRGAVRLAGGGVVVANGGSKELRYYDARGRFLRAAGGEGGGPGEFGTLDALVAYRGDSLAAWDAGPRRVSVFGPDGTFGRATTVRGLSSVTARLRAAFADGSLVLEPTGTADDYLRMASGERRDSVSFVRVAADGELSDTLARRGAREYVSVRSGNLILQRPVLFGRDSYVGAAGGRAFVAESDQYRVDVVDPRGGAVMSIRRPVEPRPATRDELARAREEAAEGRERNRSEMLRMAGTALPEQADEEVPARPTLPAFDRVLVDARGFLWVRDYLVSSADAPRWSVFDAEGRWTATVQNPAGVDVYQIGDDWILGRALDELDVESVRLYRLRRGAEGDEAGGAGAS